MFHGSDRVSAGDESRQNESISKAFFHGSSCVAVPFSGSFERLKHVMSQSETCARGQCDCRRQNLISSAQESLQKRLHKGGRISSFRDPEYVPKGSHVSVGIAGAYIGHSKEEHQG